MPRVKTTNLLDLFGSTGLVPSDLQDKIRYQEGLSEQLAGTIRKMEGVVDASVQITFAQEGAEPAPLTASVYIKHRGVLDNPNSVLVTKIKRLVSSAVPGLTIDNVTVVTDRATLSEISLEPSGFTAEEKNVVSIWGITVAKSSAPAFRTIFYLFLIFLFIFLCLSIWLLWKFYPLIERLGPRALITGEQFVPTQFAAAPGAEAAAAETTEELPR